MIIALTGGGQDQVWRRSQDTGFNHLLVKPVVIAAAQPSLPSGKAMAGSLRSPLIGFWSAQSSQPNGLDQEYQSSAKLAGFRDAGHLRERIKRKRIAHLPPSFPGGRPCVGGLEKICHPRLKVDGGDCFSVRHAPGWLRQESVFGPIRNCLVSHPRVRQRLSGSRWLTADFAGKRRVPEIGFLTFLPDDGTPVIQPRKTIGQPLLQTPPSDSTDSHALQVG